MAERLRPPAPPLSIRLGTGDLRRLCYALLTVEVLLVVGGLASIWIGESAQTVTALFDMDGESTIPAWFSSMQLFAIGAVLLVTGWQRPLPVAAFRTLLLTAGAGFVLLSMDEASEFHEKLSWLLGNAFESLPRFRTGYGIWMYLYLPAAAGVVLLLRREIASAWRAFPRESTLAAAGFGITLAGAMLLESLGYLFLRDDLESIGYRLEVVVEEFLEMAGMTLVLYAALGVASRALSRSAQDQRADAHGRHQVAAGIGPGHRQVGPADR